MFSFAKKKDKSSILLISFVDNKMQLNHKKNKINWIQMGKETKLTQKLLLLLLRKN